MASIQGKAFIVKNEKLTDTIFKMVLQNDFISELAIPGQFVHILCGEKTLRRPISICKIDSVAHCIEIVFEIRGDGTDWISKQEEGEYLDIIGPLGNGFKIDSGKNVLVIGGGIGVPPMLGLAEQIENKCDALLGFKNIESSILVTDFLDICNDVYVTTDDGTLGEQGFVTDTLSNLLYHKKYDVIYACGPTAMLSNIYKIASENNIECYVSLEERMGCGIGACLTCACKVKKDGEIKMQRVCKDGPVFDAKEVVWNG